MIAGSGCAPSSTSSKSLGKGARLEAAAVCAALSELFDSLVEAVWPEGDDEDEMDRAYEARSGGCNLTGLGFGMTAGNQGT